MTLNVDKVKKNGQKHQKTKGVKSQIVTFLIKCPDQKGLVAKITNFFYEKGFNILSCQQHVNKMENKFRYYLGLISLVVGIMKAKNKSSKKNYSRFYGDYK